MKDFQNKIDSLIRFFLYLLIFWLPFGNAVIESCVGAAFFLWLVKRFVLIIFGTFKDLTFKERIQQFLNGFKVKNSFLNLPIVIFLYICLLSALWSRVPLHSLHGLISKILEWFVIYFLVLEFFTEKKHIIVALFVFLFSVTSVCVDSLAQFYITGKSFFCDSGFSGRATSCFYTGNDLGGYLLFPLALSYSFLTIGKESRIRKIIACVLFILIAWTTIVTFSRGAWLAVIFGGGIFLFLKNKKIFLLSAIALTVLASCLFVFMPSSVEEKSRLSPEQILSTIGWRKNLWIDSLKMVWDKPLLGHGPNTFMQTFQKKQYRRRGAGYATYDPSFAHNCYVQMAAETGVLGLGCFLWILWSFLKTIFSSVLLGKEEDKDLSVLLFGIWIGCLIFLAHSFVDTHLYSLKLSSLFWVMVGISVSGHKLLSRHQICDIKEP